MKVKMLALAVSTLGLVACGGGGGSSGASPSNNVSVAPVVNKTGNTNTGININTNANTSTNKNTNTGVNTANTGNKTTPQVNTLTDNTKLTAISHVSKQTPVTQVAKPAPQWDKEIKAVLDETNRLRREKGLPALTLDANLSAHAQQRAMESQYLFEHQRPDGTAWQSTIKVSDKAIKNIPAGGSISGVYNENLAAGTSTNTGKRAVEQWRNSPSHYEAIIDPSYTRLGVGVVYAPDTTQPDGKAYKYYWVQIFGNDNVESAYNFVNNPLPMTTTTTNTKPLQQVVIDGKTVPLTVKGDGSYQRVSGTNVGLANGYTNTRFGAISMNGADASVFYQGNQTPASAIPTSGNATYTGKAVVVRDVWTDTGKTVKVNNRTNTVMERHQNIAQANAEFNVDFAKKSLEGSIKESGKTTIGVQADIKGSTFASKSSASVHTQGAFFGDKAQELSGVFEDLNSGTYGAFGATKQ